MNMLINIQQIAATLSFCTLVFLAQAELKPGDAFPEFEAQDQHEKAYEIPTDTKYVAVTLAMGSGKKANKFFSEKGAEYLPKNKAIILSNIYGMPSIARLFAMPKMQKYPHRIMLADEKGLLDNFPEEKGKVTIFDLDASGKIISIKFWDPDSEKSPF